MRLPLDTHLLLWALGAPDRLLVVQAMAEPVLLYTADPLLPPYTELVRLVG